MRLHLRLATTVVALLLLAPSGLLAQRNEKNLDGLKTRGRQVVVRKMFMEGNRLVIEGINFGDQVGLVTLNLEKAAVDEWADTRIVVKKPADVEPGSGLVTLSRPRRYDRHGIYQLTRRDFATAWLADGAVGPPGPQGDQGAPGADGADGAPGLPGADGADGAPGLPGSDGAAGAPGLPGSDGADGAPGLPGSDGADGAPGLPGANGSDGAPGLPGANGSDGAPGLSNHHVETVTRTATVPGFNGPGSPGLLEEETSCVTGTVLGGGYEALRMTRFVKVFATKPSASGQGWSVVLKNEATTPTSFDITIFAVCADVAAAP